MATPAHNPFHDPFDGTGLTDAANALARGPLAAFTTSDDLKQDSFARVLHSERPLVTPLLRTALQTAAADDARKLQRRPCTVVSSTELERTCDGRGSSLLWADGSKENHDPLELVLAAENADEHAERVATGNDRLAEAVAGAGVTPHQWQALHAAKFPEHRSRPYTGADRAAATAARRKLTRACNQWLEGVGLTNRPNADPPVENVLAEAGLLRPDVIPGTC